jgi:glycosyltransferase involved in cell wall biosynthesis
MRILQLMKWLSPYQNVGGKIRSYGLGKALASFAEVDAVGYLPSNEQIHGTEEHLSHYRQLYPLGSGKGLERYWDFGSAAARGFSLRTARFASRRLPPFLADVLKKGRYDVLHVEELPLMSLASSVAGDIPIVFSTHNVESNLSTGIFRSRNPIFRLLARLEKTRTAREEHRALGRAKAWLAVSEQDHQALNSLCPETRARSLVIPNCAQDRFQPADHAKQPSAEILCMGAFGWHPNRQGLLWFVDSVLPLLKRDIPEACIRIVGSGIDKPLQRRLRQLGLQVHTNVPDVLPFLQQARMLCVPLQVGGGSRIKIVEAWAAGLPVVSTSIGADGLLSESGSDLLLADQPADFARAILTLMSDDAAYEQIRANGLKNARALRWTAQGPALQALYRRILATGEDI